MEPTKQPTKQPTKRKKKRRRFRSLLFMLFWAMILISFGVLIVHQAGEYNSMHATLLSIEAEIAAEQAELEELQQQLMFFDSDAHVEQLARERLGMIRTYEIVFRNVASGN